MKVNIKLYGCLRHFYELSQKERTDALRSLEETFEKQFPLSREDLGPLEKITCEVNLDQLPMDAVFFADVTITENATQLNPADLDRIAMGLGPLWKEYVWSFVNAAGFVGMRVGDLKTRIKWSPHGK